MLNSKVLWGKVKSNIPQHAVLVCVEKASAISVLRVSLVHTNSKICRHDFECSFCLVS